MKYPIKSLSSKAAPWIYVGGSVVMLSILYSVDQKLPLFHPFYLLILSYLFLVIVNVVNYKKPNELLINPDHIIVLGHHIPSQDIRKVTFTGYFNGIIKIHTRTNRFKRFFVPIAFKRDHGEVEKAIKQWLDENQISYLRT